MSKPKIYGFNNGGSSQWYYAVAIAEDGTCLAQHVCSHEGYMPHDLGMDGQSDWKHEHYKEHYPDGFETEFISSDKLENHEGLKKAMELNKKQAEAAEVPK